MQLRYYKIFDSVPDPRFMTRGSACFDICADLSQPVTMFDKQSMPHPAPKLVGGNLLVFSDRLYKVGTGLVFDIPVDYVLKVYIRPSVAGKLGILLANSVGIIDCDYTDELFVLLYATRDTVIEPNQRIVQAELVRSTREHYNLAITPDRPNPKMDRRGGFGSTGK